MCVSFWEDRKVIKIQFSSTCKTINLLILRASLSAKIQVGEVVPNRLFDITGAIDQINYGDREPVKDEDKKLHFYSGS